MKITFLKARQIFDSRGNPTIETDLILDDQYFGRASIPSGASKGKFEALELRDNTKDYCGKSVFKAIDIINNTLSSKLFDLNITSQKDLDSFLIEIDGTNNKSNLGANTILSISLAFAKAQACLMNKQLFQSWQNKNDIFMPYPMLNIINGGIHADNQLDIQEFMIVPTKYETITHNLKIAYEVYQNLKKILISKNYTINTGDEGGFAPNINSSDHALDLIIEAIEKSGYIPGKDVSLALDVAANELYSQKKYNLREKNGSVSPIELVDFYKNLCSKYPIISIEDPFDEEDTEHWKILTKELGDKISVVGDDLFVTNPEKLKNGIAEKLANSILIKMNQIGTLTETFESIEIAKKNNFTTIISHRSGETEDTSISHLAVATQSKFIKAGAIARTDRVCKYNELIRIEELLHNN
ncbi:MAG: enolase [Candidatus Midichloriaceae bacterium]|jgi:enolase